MQLNWLDVEEGLMVVCCAVYRLLWWIPWWMIAVAIRYELRNVKQLGILQAAQSSVSFTIVQMFRALADQAGFVCVGIEERCNVEFIGEC